MARRTRKGFNRDCSSRSGLRAFRDCGFTLLELIVVILVIVLVVGISYPSLMRGTSAFQLRATGRDVLNMMRYAREKAITEQSPMLVVFDRDAQKVVLSDALGGNPKTRGMPHDVRIVRMVMEGKEVRQGPLAIRYLPNGSAEDAQIVLGSDRGGSLRLIADPITGGARIVLGQGENAP